MPTEKSRQICLHRQELEHERVLCPTRNSSFFFFSHAIHCSLSIFTIGCSLISHLVQHNTALAHMYNNPAQHCVMYSMQSPKESKNTSEEDPAPKLVFEEEKKKKKTALVSLEKPRQKCWLYLFLDWEKEKKENLVTLQRNLEQYVLHTRASSYRRH